MKKLFSVIAGLALFSGSQAFAWVGGPFDNGDYSATLDNEGIYQATFRMKNGSGFAQFGTNVDLFASTTSGDSGGSSTDLTLGSYLNRSLIYFKGVTYFGSATGIVDMERRRIDGITNGYTEASATSSTSSDSGSVSASQTIVFNGGRGFSCNSTWIAKITQTYPVLKFNGSGEFTALPQDLSALLTGLAVTIVENNDSVGLGDLPALGDYLASLTETGAESVHMKVFGSRKFFLGRR